MSSKKIITPAQCRGARAVLEWSQEQLATEAGVNRMTVADFEQGKRSPLRNNLVMIRQALEKQGITFIEENGGPPGIREPRHAEAAPAKLADPPSQATAQSRRVKSPQREEARSGSKRGTS
jgi:transcriptional regulator with XRE-family HTH domain